MPSVIDRLVSAIARMEGATDAAGNWVGAGRSGKNNNPGNLRDVWDGSRWRIWPGLPHDDAGFPRFPSVAAGWDAMRRDLGLKIARGDTLEQLVSAWAPPHENDTAGYLRAVAAWSGVPQGVPLATLDSQPRPPAVDMQTSIWGSIPLPSSPGDTPYWFDDLMPAATIASSGTLLAAAALVGIAFWLRSR